MIFLAFIPIFLFGIALDFSPCYKKFSFIKDSIPISKTKSITFKKVKDFLYYDPFTKMYIISSHNKKFLKFARKEYKLGWFLAAIKKNSVYGGTAASKMIFFSPAKLSVNIPFNSVISDLFCRVYGLSNKEGFIESSYIKHFLKYHYYGDIGIEVDEDMNVKYVDPFYVKGVNIGDKLILINGKKANVDSFKKEILFSKEKKQVVIKTNKKVLFLKVRRKIFNFTPLFHFGIILDGTTIKKFSKNIQNRYFIAPPAKIIAINGKRVYSINDIKRILSSSKDVTITIKKEGMIFKLNLNDVK